MRSSLELGGHWWFGPVLLLLAGCVDWDAYRVGTGAQGGAGGAGAGGTGQTSGTGTGTGSGGTTSPPEPCGLISMLADDFTATDGMRPRWEMTDHIAIVDGEAVITGIANSPEDSWRYIFSQYYYDLRGEAVSIEVKSPANPVVQTYFKIYYDDDSSLTFALDQSRLTFAKTLGGEWNSLGDTPYDPAAHRFWRMRESSGIVYWETSGDNVSWTVQSSSSNAIDVSSVRVEFGVGSYANQSEPGEAHFDNLNGGLPKGGWCKASSLRDDFGDSAVDHRWNRAYFDDTCQHAEGGELSFKVGAGNQGGCGYRSASPVDLTGDTVAVEVPSAPDKMLGGQAALQLVFDDKTDRRVLFALEYGQLYFREVNDQSTKAIDEAPYDPIEHRFWRFREQAGQLFWETSPDGQTWKTRAQEPNPFPVNALGVELTGSLWETETAPFEVHFDNVNLP